MRPRTRWLSTAVLIVAPLILLAQEIDYPHGEFEDDCTLCHRAESWSPAEISDEFDHTERGFVLDGSHSQTNCRGCHATLEFAVADAECVSCHLDPHQEELGPDCVRCHTPRSFIDRSTMIREHLGTRLPLDGAHRVIDCEECHEPVSGDSLQFVNLPTSCDACHLSEYLATSDPDHQASGFSQQCESCHSTRSWLPARFNHRDLASGADCVSCHLENYLAAADPDHAATGISQQCEDCHSTNGWRPATFDHDQLPPGSQCVSCHLEDFLTTANPDHGAAGFPQQCEDCHTTNGWRPATFDHDIVFPIYSGKHRNEWSDCTDCHVNPSNYTVFSCIDCHKHDDPDDLAGKHENVSNYVYESIECYNCHPQGDD